MGVRLQPIKRNADLLIKVDAATSDADLVRLRNEIKEHFSGHRAIIFRANDLEITPLVRLRSHPYRPSMLAHGGRVPK